MSSGGGNQKSDGQVEEDAAECKFPKGIVLFLLSFWIWWFFLIGIFSEFETTTCDALLTAEVYLLLEHRRQSSESKDEIEEMSEVVSKLFQSIKFIDL